MQFLQVSDLIELGRYGAMESTVRHEESFEVGQSPQLGRQRPAHTRTSRHIEQTQIRQISQFGRQRPLQILPSRQLKDLQMSEETQFGGQTDTILYRSGATVAVGTHFSTGQVQPRNMTIDARHALQVTFVMACVRPRLKGLAPKATQII